MTAFDGIVIGLILASAALAAVRGFARETASILEIVGAAFISLWLFSLLRGPDQSWMVDAAMVVGLLIVSYVILRILLGKLSVRAANSYPPMVDRGLGLGFGVLRGLLLVALAYLGYSYVQDRTRQPEWVRTAATYPLVSSMSNALAAFAPEQEGGVLKQEEDVLDLAPAPEPDETASTEGYGAADRGGLEEILTTTTTSESP